MHGRQESTDIGIRRRSVAGAQRMRRRERASG
jgi:hypothetical protein